MAEYCSSEVGLKYVLFTGRDQMLFIMLDFNFFPMLKGNLQYRQRPSGAVLGADRGRETEKEHQPLIYSRRKLVEKWLHRFVNPVLSPSFPEFTQLSE